MTPRTASLGRSRPTNLQRCHQLTARERACFTRWSGLPRELWRKCEKARHELWVELGPAAVADLRERLLKRPSLLVGAFREQRIVDIDDRADASGDWDRLAFEPRRVASPVPALVV